MPYEWELKIIYRDGSPVLDGDSNPASFHSNEDGSRRGPLTAFTGLETLNDTAAAATATLPLDADANDWLVEDRLVLLYVRGTFVTGWTVGAADDTLLAKEESNSEQVEHHCPHLNAVLNEALVYPARGMDAQPPGEDRIFDSSDPSYDGSAWDSAVEVAVVADVQSGGSTPWPLPFATEFDTGGELEPDAGTISVIGPSENISGVSPDDDQPPGFYYFYKDIGFDAGFYRFQSWWDDGGELRVDGATLIEDSAGFARAHEADMIAISAGTHRVWAKVGNGPPNGTFVNLVGLVVRIAQLDASGTEIGLWSWTDGSWNMWTDVDTTPGFTPGDVGALEFFEGVSRECWEIPPGDPAHLALGFSGTEDADAVSWDETWDISTKAGETGVGEHCKEMSETYVDFVVQWDDDEQILKWRLWHKDGRGETKDVAFERAVNIGLLNVTREPTKMTAAVCKWHGGFHEVSHSPVAGHPRKEAGLSTGAQRSIAEVERVAGPQLDQFGRIREKPAIKIVTSTETPDDVMPGLAFWVGDTITIPGDRTFAPVQARVIAMTVELGDSGQMVFTPEFGDLTIDPSARPAQAMRRMAPGGTTRVVSQPSFR